MLMKLNEIQFALSVNGLKPSNEIDQQGVLMNFFYMVTVLKAGSYWFIPSKLKV